MNIYRFYWLDGTTTVWEGETVEDSFSKAGYSMGAMQALDFWEENEASQTYNWNAKNKTWEKINKEI